MRVVGEPEVLARLREHRMHEMRSTGRPLEDFAEWIEAPEGRPVRIPGKRSNLDLEVTTHRAAHSELCFGAVVRCGGTSIGWTADSAFDAGLLASITAGTDLAIVDARRSGGSEHASFEEIRNFVASADDVEFFGVPCMKACCRLVITGYGTRGEAPGPDDGIPETAVLRPGFVLSLPVAAPLTPVVSAAASLGPIPWYEAWGVEQSSGQRSSSSSNKLAGDFNAGAEAWAHAWNA